MRFSQFTNGATIRRLILISAAGAIGFSSLSASASTVSLNGSGQMAWTAQFLGSSGGNTQSTPNPLAIPPTGNDYSLSLPGQYTFQDQFTAPQSFVLSGPGTGSTVGPYAFKDTYKFAISAPAGGDILTTSLNLPTGQGNGIFNIRDLQFRLFEVASSSTQPAIGIPLGSTTVTGWMGVTGNDNGATITASFANVSSGTYFLEVAGTADGTSGGTYIGQLNLAPVPLPAALPLLLSGLAGLGAFVSRRKLRFA